MTGTFGGNATFGPGEANETTLSSAGVDDISVAKYDSAGQLQWAKGAGGTLNDQGFGIAVDGAGNSYVTGFYRGNAIFGSGEPNETTLTGGQGGFVAKYDSVGQSQWAKRAGTHAGEAIAVDGAGNSYVTGDYWNNATFGPGEANETTLSSAGLSDVSVAKYDSGGQLQWAKRAGGTSEEQSFGITVDGGGNSHVTGWFEGSATFGPGEADETTFSSAGSPDIFVANYGGAGQLQWAKRAGGAVDDRGLGIAVDGAGNSYVTGLFTTLNATFGPGEANETTLSSAGSSDIFVAKFQSRNEPPQADAGEDQSIRAGDNVSLDGSSSFDDNTASTSLVYSWGFISLPTGSTATLSGADTATPGFVADKAGSYTVALTVTDQGGVSSSANEVVISSSNLAPTANGGPNQLVLVGTMVFLDGSNSTDPELDFLDYSWSITNAPAGNTASLVGANTQAPIFTPNVDGVYQVTLSVSDFIGPGTPDTVAVTVTTAQGFAEFQIVSACDVITNLPPDQVTTEGNRRALCNFLGQAVRALQKDQRAIAIDKLAKSIERTDGCELRGAPDRNGPGRDWITDCGAQAEAYNPLVLALDAVTPP